MKLKLDARDFLSSSGVAEAGNGCKCNCAALNLEQDQQSPDF
jgi:hypothetical protein